MAQVRVVKRQVFFFSPPSSLSFNQFLSETKVFALFSVCVEPSAVTMSPFLFPESELVTEPEEEGGAGEEKDTKDTKEAEEKKEAVHCPSLADSELPVSD